MHGWEREGLENAALAALFLVFAVCVFFANRPRRRHAQTRYFRPRNTWPGTRQGSLGSDEDRASDLRAAAQIRAVQHASFRRRKILNAGEYRIFRVVENELNAIRRGYRAFAQTSLGEVLDSANSEAFLAVNSKRVDILVVDSGGWPVLAVEYQGEGHYQGTAVARDTVKNLALRSAGVGYLEILSSDGDAAIRAELRRHLAKA